MSDASSLTLFVEVARRGGFAAASRSLGIPTTTASRRIAALEDELGVRLFQRTTRSLSLTEAGRLYLERMEPIVAEIDEANRAVTQVRDEVMGRLRISAPQYLGQSIITDWVLAFQRAYPKVAVELLLETQHINLPATGMDLAFRAGTLKDDQIIARPLIAGVNRLVASPGYLAKAGTPGTPEDLREHDAIVNNPRQSTVLWRLSKDGEEKTIRPQGRLTTNDLTVAAKAALDGQGIALLPDLAVDRQIQEGELVEVLPDWSAPPFSVSLVYTSRRLATSAQRAFVDFIVARARDS